MKRMDVGTDANDDKLLRQALGAGTPLYRRPRPYLSSAFLSINKIMIDVMGLLPAMCLQILMDTEEEFALNNSTAKTRQGYFVSDIKDLSRHMGIPTKEVLKLRKQLIDRGYLIEIATVQLKNGQIEERFAIPEEFEYKD